MKSASCGSPATWSSRQTAKIMPSQTYDDLPFSVQSHLPPHAQDIYREAFNHAFEAHASDPRQEEAAHRMRG